ncbi:MAG: hypothetical protein VX498_03995, partial [Myxococcota bacterium]|nr:hypothetical protein [Myxococcota bacterium]
TEESSVEAERAQDEGSALWFAARKGAATEWQQGMQALVRGHTMNWAIPIVTVGVVGLTNLSLALYGVAIDFGLDNQTAFFLTSGGSLAGSAAMAALVHFPTMATIQVAIRRAQSPAGLHMKLKKTRLATGWATLAFAIVTTASVIAIPFTFGVTAVIAGICAASAAVLGHISLANLVFERRAKRIAYPQERGPRFGSAAQSNRRPRLVAVSPAGLVLAF